jgi:3-hydroxyisobutyrate dehydrogenase-like beta-hydroxyacid dehydrogenase
MLKMPRWLPPASVSSLCAAGAKQAATPGECIKACDITFACLTTPEVCMDVVFGADGVLSGMGAGKSYVDCSTVDEACSQKIGVRLSALMHACTAVPGTHVCVRVQARTDERNAYNP